MTKKVTKNVSRGNAKTAGSSKNFNARLNADTSAHERAIVELANYIYDPTHPIRFPNPVPTETFAVNVPVTESVEIDPLSKFGYALWRPSLENTLEHTIPRTVVILEVCYDKMGPYAPYSGNTLTCSADIQTSGVSITSSPMNIDGYDYYHNGALLSGGTQYEGDFIFNDVVQTDFVSSSGANQTFNFVMQSVGRDGVPFGNKLSYAVSLAGTTVTTLTIPNLDLATLGKDATVVPGFYIGYEAASGNLLDVYATIKFGAGGSTNTSTTGGDTITKGFRDLTLPGGVFQAIESSLSYRISAGSLRLINSTVWTERGGLLTIGWLPRAAASRMPTDAEQAFEFFNSLPNCFSKKNMPLGKGGHVPYIRQGLDEMKFREFNDGLDIAAHDSSSLLFVSWKVPTAGSGDLNLQLNMNVEIQTLSVLTPTVAVGFNYADVINIMDSEMMVSEARFSENPGHVAEIKKFASRVVKSPQMKQAISSLVKYGVPVITAALAL